MRFNYDTTALSSGTMFYAVFTTIPGAATPAFNYVSTAFNYIPTVFNYVSTAFD